MAIPNALRSNDPVYSKCVIDRDGDRFSFDVDVHFGVWHWVSRRTGCVSTVPELIKINTDNPNECEMAVTALIRREAQESAERVCDSKEDDRGRGQELTDSDASDRSHTQPQRNGHARSSSGSSGTNDLGGGLDSDDHLSDPGADDAGGGGGLCVHGSADTEDRPSTPASDAANRGPEGTV